MSVTPETIGDLASNNTPPTGLSVQWFYSNWRYKLRVYSLVICTTLGSLANMAAFLVFLRSRMKYSSTGVYLMTLAWLDTLYLLTEALIQLHVLAIDDNICAFAWYLRDIFRLLEAFVVVAVCVDRLIPCVAPYRSYKCSNLRCAALMIMGFTAISLVLSSYSFNCVIKYDINCKLVYGNTKLICTIAHFIITAVIGELVTSLLVIVMAIQIGRALRNLRQRARRLSIHGSPLVDKEVTRMTAAVAFVFSCFRLPYSLVYIPFYVRHMFKEVPYRDHIQQNLTAATEITRVIYNLNYCVNFIIYLLFWRAFKKKFLDLILCRSSVGYRDHHVYKHEREVYRQTSRDKILPLF